jgi:hypothetical protein
MIVVIEAVLAHISWRIQAAIIRPSIASPAIIIAPSAVAIPSANALAANAFMCKRGDGN